MKTCEIKDKWAKSIEETMIGVLNLTANNWDSLDIIQGYIGEILTNKVFNNNVSRNVNGPDYILENLDGVWELVNKYVPAKVDNFSTRLLTGDMCKYANRYNDEITNRAIKVFDELIDEEYLATVKLEETKDSDEYRTLKEDYDKVGNYSTKALIWKKIKEYKKQIKEAELRLLRAKRKISVACTGSTGIDGELDKSTIKFLEIELPEIKQRCKYGSQMPNK